MRRLRTNAPPQLQLVGARLSVDGDVVTVALDVAAPFDAFHPEPNVVYTWAAAIIAEDRARNVIVHRTGETTTTTVRFSGPHGMGEARLDNPCASGNTMTIVVDLKTLKWSGKSARWSVSTGMLRGDDDVTEVDQISETTFTG
jgi:hypothetical protein